MKIECIAREKLVEKGIDWKQVYTDKTQFLKDQFEAIIGPGSYFRFEGTDLGSGDSYYCIIGPARIHHPKAKFFTGVRKLPATFSAGGKYFDSMDTAARYARETWGVKTPDELKPYTSAALYGISSKATKWKEEREDNKEDNKEDDKKSKKKEDNEYKDRLNEKLNAIINNTVSSQIDNFVIKEAKQVMPKRIDEKQSEKQRGNQVKHKEQIATNKIRFKKEANNTFKLNDKLEIANYRQKILDVMNIEKTASTSTLTVDLDDSGHSNIFSKTIDNLIKIAKELDSAGKNDAAEEVHKVIRKYQERI